MMKTCTNCLVEKKTGDFPIRHDRPCGIKSRCKKCEQDLKKKSPNYKAVVKKTNLKTKSYRKEWKASEKGKLSSKAYNVKTNYSGQKKWAKTSSGRIYQKVKNDKSKDSMRRHHLSKRYKLTMEQYNSMLKGQDECCNICGKHSSKIKNRMSVDHSHNTGEVRGLLCQSCNVGIGFFKDNIEILAKAMSYLKRTQNLKEGY